MKQSVLILGGNGVIGSAIARELLREGHNVRTISRGTPPALPGADRRRGDVTRLDVEGWHRLLDDVDVVVNAAGALQNGLRDDLESIHVGLLERLVAAIGDRQVRIVQISAAGASADATTDFMRTKAKGDARLAASGCTFVILRPALVLAPTAFGGTALLRAAAALPVILPRLFPGAQVQTVFIDDLTHHVRRAVEGDIAAGRIVDLAEEEAHSFPELLSRMRSWLNLPPGRTLAIPAPIIFLAASCADLAGWLGWLSPMRSNALRTLSGGVTADPASDLPCRPLHQTLAAMPATTQDRRFARTYLLLPVAILTLSLFWIVSGLVALGQVERAAAVLGEPVTRWQVGFVIATALLDIALGAAVLVRRWARRACLVMIAVATGYLLGSVLLTPELWTDPLGPMVKVFPAITIALVTASLLDER